MPQITINGTACEFSKGQTIIQAADAHGVEIPRYCYHPGLSIPANCRICLAEVSQLNPKTGKLERIPKLMPTCHTAAVDGMVVSTVSEPARENQKQVMEFLMINHPVDCPVCDQAGECTLQDYSYQHGNAQSRFQEQKIKQPKKDVGEHVLLYSDRCIMCTRCVRFTREVTGTNELMVSGRGGTESIDVFPGQALEAAGMSGNVVDLCPVGALLDKDFLFKQRVWFLKRVPSIDGITASGDNIWVEQNEGRVWRLKPRENAAINQWWMTDEVRYGWKFIHSDERLTLPTMRGAAVDGADPAGAWNAALSRADALLRGAVASRTGVALAVSPMLSCEDAFLLAHTALAYDPDAILGIGPVPVSGSDRTVGTFTISAEKAPNARGVRRTLEAVAASFPGRSSGATVHDWSALRAALAKRAGAAVILTGNYPGAWQTPELIAAVNGHPLLLLDTLRGPLCSSAEVVMPAATWLEKDGSFESARGHLQGFCRAIEPVGAARSEGQVAIDLDAIRRGVKGDHFDVASIRAEMGATAAMEKFATLCQPIDAARRATSDMQFVEI